MYDKLVVAWTSPSRMVRNRILRTSAFIPMLQFRTLASDVRVRFAPSPTGDVHLGGLRTALYNFLFARANKGKFILRIEDTDQSRVIKGASEKIEDDLKWAGIVPDESPLVGGPYGPYFQSQRLHLYRKHTETLIDMGKAYPCFCSNERLELIRKQAIRLQAVPKYDNHCRGINATEITERMKNGESYCVRFKLEAGLDHFHDLVYGDVTLDTASYEGDPIILKTDGFPTYHLACVVDDHLMEISHVLRGVEWQISTSKHRQIYWAFGWQPPKFGHLPLLLNAGGGKLSKRQGDVDVDHFRRLGIFPDVLRSFVTEFGGGFRRETGPGVKPKVYSLDDLIQQFDFATLNRNSCRVDLDRLVRLNRLEIDERLKRPDGMSELCSELRAIVYEHFGAELPRGSPQLSDARLAVLLRWGLPRMSRLANFVGPDLKFLWVRPSSSALLAVAPEAPQVDADLLKWASSYTIQNATNVILGCAKDQKFMSDLRKECAKMNVDYKRFTKLLRVAVCGLKAGPPIMELIQLLGPEEVATRLDVGAEALQISGGASDA